jgi:AcrR family transcriptional regulator
MDRLLLATAELLAERGFAEVSVAEIAARAGCSVGAFYARFPDKEAVLRTLEQQLRIESLTLPARLCTGPRWASQPLEAVVRRFVAVLAGDGRPLALTRAFTVHSVVDASYRPSFQEGRAAILGRLEDAFVARVLERTAELADPAPEAAARVAFRLAVAAMEQRMLLGPEPALDDHADADAVLRLLGPPPAPRRPSRRRTPS